MLVQNKLCKEMLEIDTKYISKTTARIYRMTVEHKLCSRRHNYRGFVTVICTETPKETDEYIWKVYVLLFSFVFYLKFRGND